MSDCIHHLDLCPDCQGLRVARLDRIEGITSVTLDGDSVISSSGPTRVYIGPIPEDCPDKDTAP